MARNIESSLPNNNQEQAEERKCRICKTNQAGPTGACHDCFMKKVRPKDLRNIESRLNKNPYKGPISEAIEKRGKSVEEPSPFQENSIKDWEDSGN